MKTILITGFEPFGGEMINPSWELAKCLDKLQTGEYCVISRQLACVFDIAQEQLVEYLQEIKPEIVINIGQAGGRANISLEKIAVNLIDARIADNSGKQPIDEVISYIGENAYFTNLPLKAISQELNNKGIPNSISYTAGTFVCNCVFYKLMEYINERNLAVKGGFIHIPYLPEQVTKLVNQPSMSLDILVSGFKIIISSIINNPNEIKISGGAIC